MTAKEATVMGAILDQLERDVAVIGVSYEDATAEDKARISAVIRRLQTINAVEELRLQNLANIRDQSGKYDGWSPVPRADTITGWGL